MGAIDLAKEVAGLVKKIGDMELYQKIVELQGDLVDLSTRNLELGQKCRELQAELNLKKSLKHSRSLYGAEGDPVPFCPRCYENNDKLIHLYPMETQPNSPYQGWECHTCFFNFVATYEAPFRPELDIYRRNRSERKY